MFVRHFLYTICVHAAVSGHCEINDTARQLKANNKRDIMAGTAYTLHVHVHQLVIILQSSSAFTLHWPDFCYAYGFIQWIVRVKRTIFFWSSFFFSISSWLKLLSRLSNILHFIWMSCICLFHPFLFVFSIWLQLRAYSNIAYNKHISNGAREWEMLWIELHLNVLIAWRIE